MYRLLILDLYKILAGLNAEIKETKNGVEIKCNDEQTELIADAFLDRNFHGKMTFENRTFKLEF